MDEHRGEGNWGRLEALIFDLEAETRIGSTYHVNWSKSLGWQSQNKDEVRAYWQGWRDRAAAGEDLHPIGVYEAVLDLLDNHPIYEWAWADSMEEAMKGVVS